MGKGDFGMVDASETPPREYFRRDQRDGISPPDLSKECTYAEHIVHARGKRTRFTSLSLDLTKIKDFGDTNYRLERAKLVDDQHGLVEHEELIDELRRTIRDGEKADRLLAVQAMRYATKRKEGLVNWSFDISRVARKDLLTWTTARIQVYFTRLR
jgi:hypothetical protein